MEKDIEKNIEKSVEKKSFSIKVLALVIAAVMVFSMTFMYAKNTFAANTPVFGNVSITMLDVGQGLSILVESDGEYMLYDGGGRKASRYVVSYLKNKGIDSLKDVVISHFDEDHCAGIVGVLNSFPVQQIYMPNYSTDTKIYSSLISEIKNTETPFCYPYVGDTFYVGSAKAEVLGPAGYDYTDANDDSIIVRISCGTFSCLITGDAEDVAEHDLVASGKALKSTLYVAGHHGSASSSSSALLNSVLPEYAFISVGEKNNYGHPAQKTMEEFKKRGIKIFRTDKQGEVSAIYKSGDLSFSTSPSEDYSYRTSGSSDAAEDNTYTSDIENTGEKVESTEYILNTNTGKFHRPSCRMVLRMSDANKKVIKNTKEELLAEGYEACKVCRP